MKINEAYNIWAEQYDSNDNKTRDLEGLALREVLAKINFENCLEVGCGTGKNTKWLVENCKEVIAIDFSEKMLQKAKEKVKSEKVTFHQADILQNWTFAKKQFDLIVFSLVLEHIENLEGIFKKAANTITNGGYVYIGELHPLKQYSGSKARFETENGLQVLTCNDHHVSDFTNAAKNAGFEVIAINEYFDEGDRKQLPRILSLLFEYIGSS